MIGKKFNELRPNMLTIREIPVAGHNRGYLPSVRVRLGIYNMSEKNFSIVELTLFQRNNKITEPVNLRKQHNSVFFFLSEQGYCDLHPRTDHLEYRI